MMHRVLVVFFSLAVFIGGFARPSSALPDSNSVALWCEPSNASACMLSQSLEFSMFWAKDWCKTKLQLAFNEFERNCNSGAPGNYAQMFGPNFTNVTTTQEGYDWYRVCVDCEAAFCCYGVTSAPPTP